MSNQNLPSKGHQTDDWMLSSEAQAKRKSHREWIAGRAFTLLSHYWREDDNEALTAAIGRDWANVLEPIPQEYLERACIKYQRDEPRRKPTPGAIYQIAKAMMPAPRVVPTSATQAPSEPQRERVSADVAQRLCEEMGYAPKRFGTGNE